MIRYMLSRLTHSLLLLALMSVAIYLLIGLMPGDPLDMAMDPGMKPEDVARLKALYGLDRPLWERYLTWAGRALAGDFGYSRLTGAPVLDVLAERLGNTVLLMGTAFLLAIALAIPLGVMAALRQHRTADNVINVICFAGISIPPFWLALLLITVFAVVLGWLPAGGMPQMGAGFWETLSHMLLPVATLTLASVGDYTRFVRASMLEVLRQDYIRTARAKGAATPRVVIRHAMRNALIPVVTIMALQFGGLFSGALVTETMFSWLGMGKTIYDAVMGNDYNLALVGLMVATAIILFGNLLADLTYAWLDPRISYP